MIVQVEQQSNVTICHFLLQETKIWTTNLFYYLNHRYLKSPKKHVDFSTIV